MSNVNHARETGIIIIGSGFGGLGMGLRLKQAGREDFVILERAQDVGGTWRDNDYPGVACDVPSHLYSFSFMTKPDWSRVFSPGGEIQDYLRRCARDGDLIPHIHFGAEMLSAQWDEAEGLWTVETPLGSWSARFLVSACGVLSEAVIPEIPGLESFPGEIFHSAQWDHASDLSGKRIGVVGSGASAIQIVPEMAKIAAELTVFQRTPAYIIPRPDRPYSEAEKRSFARLPEAVERLRSEIFWMGEFAFAQRRGVPAFVEQARQMALDHLAAQVPDAALRAKLTPQYEIGCKRVLLSNEFYPALAAPGSTLEPSALTSVEGSTVTAASGARYTLDALVFATGFEVTQPPSSGRIHDAGGRSLAEAWSTGMKALDSITVAGFPNLFLINGPNTGLGHHSMVYMIEAQVDYILGALDHAATLAVPVLRARPEAQEAYVADMYARSAATVWLAGGCSSWYLDPRNGQQTVLWPDFAYAFRDENAAFDPAAYRAEA